MRRAFLITTDEQEVIGVVEAINGNEFLHKVTTACMEHFNASITTPMLYDLASIPNGGVGEMEIYVADDEEESMSCYVLSIQHIQIY